jgi:hypothetical protein
MTGAFLISLDQLLLKSWNEGTFSLKDMIQVVRLFAPGPCLEGRQLTGSFCVCASTSSLISSVVTLIGVPLRAVKALASP